MKLEKLLANINYELISGSLDTLVSGIFYDSRKVTTDSMFVCLSGSSVDGHNYIESAIKNGAKVIMVEKEVEKITNITIIKVADTRKILSPLAVNYYDNPSSKLITIGITGTKGKTTTSWMIKNILEEDHKKVGIIGTMGVFFNDKHYDTVNTTPESLDIQKYLSEMVNDGIKYVIMEVSSQALKVGRVSSMTFDYGIFTNLTKDHIGENEHKDMEEYIHCKSLLFKMCKYGIFNIDDKYYPMMIKDSSCKTYTFGHNKEADLSICNVKLLRQEQFIGLEMQTEGSVNDTLKVNTPGEFSAYNAACAILVSNLLGCHLSSIKNALAKVAVRGRVEIVPINTNYTVIIDYAHNGVSTESILTTMRKYNPKRIISLFGCGGNRSTERRYDMGEVSGKYADLTIITEDNSRNEEVANIMNDIEIGIKKTNGKYIKIPDRREAIKYAISHAQEGDIILILGKGHETYQEKNGIRTHFDDREEVLKLFN